MRGELKMIKFLSAFAIAIAMFTAVPVVHAGGGSDVPFPLDYPLPFPWNTIEGVWVIESQEYTGMFAFQVLRSQNGRQILKVLQLDPDTEKVLSQGIGYQADKFEQVYAGMGGVNGSFMLYVGAYTDTTSIPHKKAYVLGISSFAGNEGQYRFKIRKVRKKVPVTALQPSPCDL